jgi:hypothetical protein
MTTSQLATELAVWSKHKWSYDDCLLHAQKFHSGILGDGIIKDYFMTLVPKLCRIPTCTNNAVDVYCKECLSMKGVVPGLLKSLSELACAR